MAVFGQNDVRLIVKNIEHTLNAESYEIKTLGNSLKLIFILLFVHKLLMTVRLHSFSGNTIPVF